MFLTSNHMTTIRGDEHRQTASFCAPLVKRQRALRLLLDLFRFCRILPHTYPSELSEQWTMTVCPAHIPTAESASRISCLSTICRSIASPSLSPQPICFCVMCRNGTRTMRRIYAANDTLPDVPRVLFLVLEEALTRAFAQLAIVEHLLEDGRHGLKVVGHHHLFKQRAH